MTVRDLHTEAFRQPAKTIRPQTGDDLSAQPHGAKLLASPGHSGLLKFLFEKGIIKMSIMRDKYFPLQLLIHQLRDLRKRGSVHHHFLVDAGKSCNIGRDMTTRV